MKYTIYCLATIGVLSCNTGREIPGFLRNILNAPLAQRAVLAESFLQQQGQFPVIENNEDVYFVYYGQAQKVQVAGDFTGWKPHGLPMKRVDGTQLWYMKFSFEPDARLDYKFVIDGEKWILDPLNDKTMVSGYGPNSELSMPLYEPASELAELDSVTEGTMWDTVFYSDELQNERPVYIYLPEEYVWTKDSYPLLLVHDGLEFLEIGRTKIVLDNLIFRMKIKPLIAVFVPPVERRAEYEKDRQQTFIRFLMNEVLATLQKKFRISERREDHAVLGISLGGNLSLAMGLSHPEYFGNIGAFSSYVQESLGGRFAADPKLLRIYLDRGKYDLPLLLPLIGALREELDEAGYDYRYREYNEGHSWGNWRAHLDEALEFFFPAEQE